MRHVSFALLLWCIWIAAALGQTRATNESDSSALQGGAASGVAEKPIDLHVQTQKRQAEARMRAEERTRATRALPEVRMFCTNNVSTAGAARVAWEAAKLEDLDARLQQRIAELEAKRAEYEDWLHRRDEALKNARDQVVAIYSKMEPEAAANELAQMDDETAAAVLSKLNTRSASAILGEMDPTRAAHLTDEMVGANLGDGKKS